MSPNRELSRREKCRPSLSREFKVILIATDCSAELQETLEKKGFSVSIPITAIRLNEVPATDIIELGGEPDLDKVEAAIQEWKSASEK